MSIGKTISSKITSVPSNHTDLPIIEKSFIIFTHNSELYKVVDASSIINTFLIKMELYLLRFGTLIC